MLRLAHRAPAVGVIVAALVGAPLGAQQAPARTVADAPPTAAAVKLDELMSVRDFRATGIARLTPAERAALERWLADHAGQIAPARSMGDARPAMGGGMSSMGPIRDRMMDTIRPPADGGARQPMQPRRRAGGRDVRVTVRQDPVPAALEVAEVRDGGDVVQTDDGSLWETYLPDRPRAAAWEPGQAVVIRPNGLAPQSYGPAYDTLLVNAAARTTVAARYLGRTSRESDDDDDAGR